MPQDSDQLDSLPFVQLFTDGACRGNPGPGGWGVILRHPSTGKEIEFTAPLPNDIAGTIAALRKFR